ncbi:MAG: flagellar motor switch protein FliM [Planctomycetota bacterium]
MPEALSQEEVDALLNIVGDPGEGEAPPTIGGGATAVAVAPPPTQTAAGAAAEPAVPAAQIEQYNALPSHQIHIYDFKRPERVSKSQVIALEALHEVFARNVSASLSGYLRNIIEVRLISVEQFTYTEFTMSLPIPTSFNLLSCAPLEGRVILEVNPSILFPIIDRLLGGGKMQAHYLERAFTNIELGIVNTILGRVIHELRETWESVKTINFELAETESNPFLLQIVAPNEPIVLLSFEAVMGEYSGMINICIPFKVIEPIMPEFSQSNWFSSSKSIDEGGDDTSQVLDNINNAPVEVSGVLAEFPLSLVDILSLKVGDLVQTGKNPASPITLTVEGQKKFRGVAGTSHNHKVVRLTEQIEVTDPDA